MYVVLAIIAFGLLIAVHELGHFTAAKLLGVKVYEFAIGMGPKILKKKGKETVYSLRLLPFGGFCAMDEDTASDDPRAFSSQKRWRRVIILAAGGFANLVVAVIIIIILVLGMNEFVGTTVAQYDSGFSAGESGGLMVGDKILSVDGERLYYSDDFFVFVQLSKGNRVNLVIERNGEKLALNNFQVQLNEYEISDIVDGFIPNEGEQKLMVGDMLLSINGIPFSSLEHMQNSDFEYADLVVRRDGETITIDGFPLRRHEYIVDGEVEYRYGLSFTAHDAIKFNELNTSFGERLKYVGYMTINYVRLIRVSLAQLFSGNAGISDLAGPVGIVGAMNEIGQSSPSVGAALANISNFIAFIGVNIAVVNLLPIPAMDGGRILFLFINWAIEKITRRKINPKYEGYIHTGALFLLVGLMVFILVNDIIRIAGG